jgi:hypothetical protein
MSRAGRAAAVAGGFALMLSGLAGQAAAGHHFPELDPSSMGGAVTVLTGGLMLLAGRRRKA